MAARGVQAPGLITNIFVAEAWEMWNDREKIPRWIKWIDKVKSFTPPFGCTQVSKQKPDFSKWTLGYRTFKRDFEF
uniref:Uncharacterized protein n=1 Tax=Physcomitrium patens TaxID=3218 RepID=A0A2K1IF18_PHYPA|nr:hypothetical protein PHYPA_028464 [Physcomitrium patens]